MDFYHRETAKASVKKLIENLPQHEQHPTDAIRMIDREIGGLLAHPKSPYFNDYREYSTTIFPSGLEATRPGHDIILILNQEQTSVLFHGQKRVINIPKALKNPERGVAHIIGQELALELFSIRRSVLGKLKIEVAASWGVNCDANESALEVLKYYLSSQKRATIKKGSLTKPRRFFNELKSVELDEELSTEIPSSSWLSRICPCIS